MKSRVYWYTGILVYWYTGIQQCGVNSRSQYNYTVRCSSYSAGVGNFLKEDTENSQLLLRLRLVLFLLIMKPV